ncbi:type II toxin-antitoxin system RelE/ParE family toxin [Streptomyces sp. GMR22]|uniref:type II toxin-antitoxin system RelE/ParE family toxin n=1 Tax=Streptomyces sp. GMR22 TaxID=2759524 RepID=UPI0015FB1EC0|nr:type II toxin-antitoxin system RelE/ParE family toxin [Streptomyces sp. GMR22]MBA6438857.1 type II toxin-antitoxin system RelE/ParE family toxin [Streptomyces sp. GMR22]
MGERYDIELEAEVQQWLDLLPPADYLRVMKLADLLADHAETLGEPQTRHLGGKLRELRFSLHRREQRITYWLAPARRIVMLTVFHKTRMRETAEVDRAHAAQQQCETKHRPAENHEIYDRHVKEEEL